LADEDDEMAERTPRELIDLYWEEVWNKGNVELIREICTDPMIRHHPGSVVVLDHDAQIERLRKLRVELQPHFTHVIVVADQESASSVWNMTSPVEKYAKLSSIETFRVKDGRLWKTWNATNAYDHWGEAG
jgi:hypothetical protein